MCKKLVIFFVSVLFAATTAVGQGCDVKQLNFKSGEKVTYRAVYNWGFIWVNAGDVEFLVRDTTYMQQPALHLVSRGWSLKKYDGIFKVRDRFEAIVHPTTLKPFWFERDTYEGGFEAYNRYIYKHDENILDIISHTSDRPYKRDLLPIKDCTFDVVSAIYYCRTLDFDKYKKGDKIPITIAIDDEVFDLFLRYKGKEQLKTRDGTVFNTIRFSALLVEGTIFKGGEDLEVWVTDDDNKVPVLVEAKILVGSVKAVLTGMEGLKHPVTSIVKE